MKTKEEILNSHPYLKTWIENPDDSIIEVCNTEQALWAMEAYHSQFSEAVSEEDINRIYDYLEGKVVSGMELSDALEISELLLILNKWKSTNSQPSDVSDEIKDIIDCIIKYDKDDSDRNKASFFNIIQRDLKKAIGQIKPTIEGEKEIEFQNLQGAIASIQQITEDTEELNMVNYNHDQVCKLNESMIEIYTIVHQFDSIFK